MVADDDIHPRVSLCKTVQRLVVGEGREDEHDVTELAAEGTAELVDKEPRLAGVGRPHDERVERDIFRLHTFKALQNQTDCFER